MIRKTGDERRAEIIQSSLELAAEVGIAKVSTQAIADRVGIAQATVFRHFKTRNDIFRAVLEFVAGNVFKALEGQMFLLTKFTVAQSALPSTLDEALGIGRRKHPALREAMAKMKMASKPNGILASGLLITTPSAPIQRTGY